MKRIELSPQDDCLHVPSSETPLWREGYHFNGYDPLHGVGITASTGFRPFTNMKSDFVMTHRQNVFLFLGQKKVKREDFFRLGSLKIELLVPFEKWRIRMKEPFQNTRNGNFLENSKEIEFDLYFESKIPPYGRSVDRFSIDTGERFEQPGFLKGKVRIGERTMNFKGQGIRDHSWEKRDVSQWEDWYGMMGWFGSGDSMTFVNITSGDTTICEGWRRTDSYQEVLRTEINPVTESIFKTRQIHVETSREKLEMTSKPISFVTIPTGEQSTMTEILVELRRNGERGHGFLWLGRSNLE